MNENMHILTTQNSQLVISTDKSGPTIKYWGTKLKKHSSLTQLSRNAGRAVLTQGLEFDPEIRLCPLGSDGFLGFPGLIISGTANAWGVKFELIDAQTTNSTLTFTLTDEHNHLELVHAITGDWDSNVFTLTSKVRNTHPHNPVIINWCCSASIPLADRFTHAVTFNGTWSKEFKTSLDKIKTGVFTKENRRGRTSHDHFPGLIVCEEHTTETAGSALAFHLGWSGNHRYSLESTSDSQLQLQMGELLLPDEIELKPGQEYTTPKMYGTHSHAGFSTASQNFHSYVRNLIGERTAKIHLNTWEAVYFDHDIDKLKALASKASEIGVERFVLDDGWFKGRFNDKAGLGDWTVCTTRYKDGLTPLIDHVLESGMEFGIWLEPEMVNEDSDLFRAHPNWILSNPPHPNLKARNQYVLDLNRDDVFNYLFNCISELLESHQISYIKWDMNRELHQPINNMQVPGTHFQTLALYRLIKNINDRFPHVEIETCASGGGRADFAILEHTNRIWTSDNNDALERIDIQHGCSFFFPPEIMGAHIGPSKCHITGRKLPIALRAGVALMGHMGIECDLLEMENNELLATKKAFEIHKKTRDFMSTCHFFRSNKNDDFRVFEYISKDQDEALVFIFHKGSATKSLSRNIHIENLSTNNDYTINTLWPETLESAHWIERNIDIQGLDITGELLREHGLLLPQMLPDQALVLEFKSID